MEIIEQTNRTILFDVVNPEVFNMFNIMSDVDENSRSLTDEKVAEINDALLVKNFDDFLKKYNGAVPETNVFTFKRRKYLVEQFLCLMEKSARNDVNGEYDIGVVLTAKGEFLNDDEEIFGTEVLPIAKLAGDDYICLDYRKKRGITVAIWYGGESEEFHPVLRKIANSFSDFLNMINESWEY